ncbi:transglutaminase domain-containing protein [Nocardiopsis sp. RV163]|uniref:transglutaminase domain-containing protein n=1 Tax=Nocardiopsis sp. RV163 TaxID=1661388 RepID=UPI00064B8221|nr:transglutaminase domain-containing protein [Nocardiopsis sp. RV163]
MPSAPGTRAASPGPYAADAVGPVVERLRRVPDTARRFAQDATVARRWHRLDADLLAALLDAGLPAVGRGEARRFDPYDLSNAALWLGRPSIQRRAVKSWGASLRHNAVALRGPGADDAPARYRVEVGATCPLPDHPGPCRFTVLGPRGRHERLRTPHDRGALDRWVLPMPTRGPRLPGPVREITARIADVEFLMLPEAVRWDPAFLDRARVSDCGGTAAWLVAEAARRGLEARFSFGVIVARPYSSPHCWAEFRVDGRWWPVDPLLVRLLQGWGGVDPAAWDEDDSPAPLFRRLADDNTIVVSHRGVWASTSLNTERLT